MKIILVLLTMFSIQAMADSKDGQCFNPHTTFERGHGYINTVMLDPTLALGATDMANNDKIWVELKRVVKTKPWVTEANAHVKPIMLRYVGVQSHKDNIGTKSSLPTYAQCD